MLPNIIPPRTIERRATLSHKPRTRQPLKVTLPINILRIQQIHQSRDILRYPHKVIIIQSKVISTNGRNVIRLRGMRETIVFRE
jgi:hypothetical protein